MEKVTLEVYGDTEEVAQITAQLKQQNFFYEVIHQSLNTLQIVGMGADAPDAYKILVNEADLDKINALVGEKKSENESNRIDFTSYSDEKLREIILKPDEWSELFRNQAEGELDKRGIIITEAEKVEFLKKRLEKSREVDQETKEVSTKKFALGILIVIAGLIFGYFSFSNIILLIVIKSIVGIFCGPITVIKNKTLWANRFMLTIKLPVGMGFIY